MTQYDARIKEAILHPESAIREYATRHFSVVHSRDETILPLVLQATEEYGRENAFNILRAADGLPLTEECVNWLMSELEDSQRATSVELENAEFAMALLLCDPESEWIPLRGKEILALPAFPEALKPSLEMIIERAHWDWPTAWRNLLELGKTIRRRGELTVNQHRELHQFVRYLARFREEGGGQILEALRDDYSGPQKELIYWLKPSLISLAGRMRLESSIPLLMKWLKSPYDAAADECGGALGFIGTDAVVEAVANAWPRATVQEQIGMTSALCPIQSERCFEVCKKLLRREQEEDVAGMLGDALIRQFDPRAIDIIRNLVKDATRDSDPEIFDLKHDLVIASTIMEMRFPEYEEWFSDAKRDNFGWFDSRTSTRIAENFQSDESLKSAAVKHMAENLSGRLAADRATKEMILDSIAHPNPCTRRLAVEYFTRAYLPEPEVLPRIIQAVEKHGRDECRFLLSDQGSIVQTAETVDWMIREAQRPLRNQDDQLPFQVVVLRILAKAPPELLADREEDLRELPEQAYGFLERIQRRIRFSQLDPETLWQRLKDLCEAEKDTKYLNEADLPLGYDLVEALARHEAFATQKCLEILPLEIEDCEGNPLAWMEGFMVYLAGLLKLSNAIPALLDWLHQDDDWINPLAMEALKRIGTDSIVDQLVEEYPVSGWDYRFCTSMILGEIHTDMALMACLTVPDLETDPTIKTQWAASLLEQLTPRGIEPARELVMEDEDDLQWLDLREDLVAVADLFGTKFPEYEKWKDDLANGRSRFRLEWKKDASEFEDEDSFADAEEYTTPSTTIINDQPKIGRNDPCPCGSGKKYKKCCLKNASSDPRWN